MLNRSTGGKTYSFSRLGPYSDDFVFKQNWLVNPSAELRG